MSLSLAITDNQDGTGGTATISGTDAGSPNTIYTSPTALGNHPLAWTLQASRTGDGTVQVPVSPAYYFAYAAGTVANATALSPPIIFVASRDDDSIQELIRLAVISKLQSMTFGTLATPPGNLPAARIYDYPTLADIILPQLTFPCIVVSDSVAETFNRGTNLRDDEGFPVWVTILDRAAPHLPALYPTYRRWREQISRALRYQRLPGLENITFNATIEPQTPNWKPPQYDIYYSTIMFRFWVRDPRGV